MVTTTVEQRSKSANSEFKNTGRLAYLLAKQPLNENENIF
jgi:hypothetical protein